MSNAPMSHTRRPFPNHSEAPRPNLVEYQRSPELPTPLYDYTDMLKVKKTIKNLRVGGHATFENIKGHMMLDILKKYKNYHIDLVDSNGHLATLCAVGNRIYAVTTRNFVHSKNYEARPVTVADAKYSNKWFQVYCSGYTADDKFMFPKVKFTRVHFWEHIKSPKVI